MTVDLKKIREELNKLKMDEKSAAAKYVNPVIIKIDELLTKFEKPKTEVKPEDTKPEDTKKEEADKK